MRLILEVFLSLLMIISVAFGARTQSAVFMGDSTTALWNLKDSFPELGG